MDILFLSCFAIIIGIIIIIIGLILNDKQIMKYNLNNIKSDNKYKYVKTQKFSCFVLGFFYILLGLCLNFNIIKIDIFLYTSIIIIFVEKLINYFIINKFK